MTTYRRITRLLPGVGALVLLLAVFALPTYGQTNKGTIKGTVTDPNGGVVQGATVTITKVDTNSERTVTTSDEGTYEAPLLDPGVYKVAVTAPTFQTTTQENVSVQTSSTAVVDITLTLGEVGANVVITAAPALVESETSDRGSVITGREVTDLPLSGRNFTQLATLTPGVARAANSGSGFVTDAAQFNQGDPRAGNGGAGGADARGSTPAARFSRSGGAALTVNGQRATNNNFALDGVDNNEPQFGTIGVFPNPDAIAEFKVTTSIPPAEVGRASGAVISQTIQSGGNEFHGSVNYYGQNSALNALHPIIKRNGQEKALIQIHEYSATLGGPIIKDRLFFFFDFLGQRNNLPLPFDTVVPTALSRIGNFTEFDKPVFDPLTGQQFPGNIIPSNRIISQGRAYLGLYDLPTRDNRNPGQFCDPCSGSNFFSTRKNEETIDNYEIKIDHKVTDANSLTGRYTDQKTSNIKASLFQALPAGFGAGEQQGNARQLSITDTHTFSPTILNEFRFGYTKIDLNILNGGVRGALGFSETLAADIGVPNSNTSPEAGGIFLIGLTGAGFSEFAGDGGLYEIASKNPYFSDSLTVIKGKHIVKAGGEARFRFLQTICGGCSGNNMKGEFQYNDEGPIANPLVPGQVCPPESQAPGGRCFVDPNGFPYGGAGNSQANVLLGVGANTVSRGVVFGGPFHLRSQEYGLFVQDDWKATDKLTLNLGLRYDIFTPPSEEDGRLGNYDINARQVLVASGSGDRLVETDKNNFGPRLGFAYAVGSEKKLVVRGGFGLLYTLDGVDYPPQVANPPFSSAISLGSNAFDTGGRTLPINLATGPPSVTTPFSATDLNPDVNVYYIEPQQKVASVYQFQLSFQYQLGNDYSVDIGYVGNRSKNLLATRDIGSNGSASARNRAGAFLNRALAYENRASSQYDGFQAQLRKRLSNNIQGQASYTWSHTIDDSTGVFNSIGDARGSRGGPENPFDFTLDRGNSPLDIRHLLSADVIIDLPFGKGQRFLNRGGVVDKLVGGFQVSFIESARTGFPFTVVVNDQNNIGGGAVRATQIGDPFAGVEPGRYLNPDAFSTAQTCVTNAAGRNTCFGSLGRNTFRGPAIWNTDMSVLKRVGLTERLKMELTFQFFNLFNHANYTVPNLNATDRGAFGRFDTAYPGRVVQYVLKFKF